MATVDHLICVILATLFVVSVLSDKWSLSEADADFTPAFTVLEQWSELSAPEDQIVERQDSLRTAIADRDEKVMKKPVTTPDRIVNKPPNKSQDVSETDLFLLGAIEKLAYRMDFLEKRTRRLEDMLYQILAGSPNTDNEPCPEHFTRKGGVCYHISTKLLNWKAASSACRGMGAILLELHTEQDKLKFTSSVQADPATQGNDFWTGGLNPGLLWLWGTSAKPVASNSTHTEVVGNGRCLLMAYQPPTRSYLYKGADCGARHKFVCQIEDNTTERRLQRLLRDRTEPLSA